VRSEPSSATPKPTPSEERLRDSRLPRPRVIVKGQRDSGTGAPDPKVDTSSSGMGENEARFNSSFADEEVRDGELH